MKSWLHPSERTAAAPLRARRAVIVRVLPALFALLYALTAGAEDSYHREHQHLLSDASERCIDDGSVCFSGTVKIGGREVPLHASSVFRYWGFRIYAIALYAMPGDATKERILSAVPKRIEIEYFRDFTADDFKRSGRSMIEKNPLNDMAVLQGPLTQFEALYQEIARGDRYAVTYAPGEGIELAKNGTALGTIRGDTLQAAYFGIWLSGTNIDNDLRNQLLAPQP